MHLLVGAVVAGVGAGTGGATSLLGVGLTPSRGKRFLTSLLGDSFSHPPISGVAHSELLSLTKLVNASCVSAVD